MALSCGAKCLKLSLFAFNLLFFLAGVLCVGVGVWLMVDRHSMDSIAVAAEKMRASNGDLKELAEKPRAVRDFGLLLAAGGAAVVCISFVGCCGAAKEWRPLLILYTCCLMIILATEIAGVIYATVNKNQIEHNVKVWLHSTLSFYNGTDMQSRTRQDDSTVLVKVAWDKVMQKFNVSGWHKLTGGEFPMACCHRDDMPSTSSVCRPEMRFVQGCYISVKQSAEQQLGIVIALAATIPIIQFFGIVVALCLCNAISGDAVYI